MDYEDFKRKTLEAEKTVHEANLLRLVSDDTVEGFCKAMWEAREIFMRMEQELRGMTPQ